MVSTHLVKVVRLLRSYSLRFLCLRDAYETQYKLLQVHCKTNCQLLLHVQYVCMFCMQVLSQFVHVSPVRLSVGHVYTFVRLQYGASIL